LHAFLFSHMRAKRLAHPILLDLIILIIFVEKYNFRFRLNPVHFWNVAVGLLYSHYGSYLCSELRLPPLWCWNSSRRYIDVFRYRKPITPPSGMSLRINVGIYVSNNLHMNNKFWCVMMSAPAVC
jgi:hypothetical protein